jgi:hypothetical protein
MKCVFKDLKENPPTTWVRIQPGRKARRKIIAMMFIILT